MNENQVFKEHAGVMNVDIHNDDVDVTKATVYSFDYDAGKFTYKLEKNGEPISLANATKINVTLSFGNEGQAVLNATTVDKINSIISFVYPEQYLSYSGRVLGEVSIQYSNGQSLIAGYFSFSVKQAEIDNDVDLKQKFYVERFEDLDNMITNQSKEIDKNVEEMETKVTDISKQIKDNDIVKKDEIGEVNVITFGAIGDGKTDDTIAINKALRYASENNIKNVVIKNGVFMIKSHIDTQVVGNYLRNEGGIEMLDDITLHIKFGAKLKAITNDKKSYNVIRAHRKNDWKIIVDGEIEGDNDRHIGSEGEWGYGISVQGGNDFSISGTGKIYNCWGDAINLQRSVRVASESEGYYPTNGKISGVICDKNGRQGMSIEEGKNIYVKDATFSNTARIAPQYGICIEPAWRNEIDEPVCENITIDNCRIIGNKGGGITTVGTTINEDIQLKNIVVKNCYFENNGENQTLKTSAAIAANRSDIEIKDCTFRENQSIYIASCRNVDIQKVSMKNGTIIAVTDKTDKYDIKTNLTLSDSLIINDDKTNNYKSVVVFALKADEVLMSNNTIKYSQNDSELIKFTGEDSIRTDLAKIINNTLIGGRTSIKHTWVNDIVVSGNNILNSSNRCFETNGTKVSFSNNNVVSCAKGIFAECSMTNDSILEVNNNTFDVLSEKVFTAYQPNKKYTLLSLNNEVKGNLLFTELSDVKNLSDNSIVDLNSPQIVTVINSSKSEHLAIGSIFLDLNTGNICYKSFDGLHKITTTKV